jgi:hypothetical protein
MAVDHLTALDLVVGSAPKPVTKPKRDDGLLSADEAAQHLNITPDQVKGFAQDGDLHYIDVSRGKKRPRMRFTIEDLNEFIERRKRRDTACLSTGKATHRSTTSTSGAAVTGFTALRAAHLARKPKSSKR